MKQTTFPHNPTQIRKGSIFVTTSDTGLFLALTSPKQENDRLRLEVKNEAQKCLKIDLPIHEPVRIVLE